MTGEQLFRFRSRLNLTQKDLAEKLGVAPNTVARWERNEMLIPPYLELALKTIEQDIPPKKK
jgi:transcriptional regulator with XRE-family HTH domain